MNEGLVTLALFEEEVDNKPLNEPLEDDGIDIDCPYDLPPDVALVRY